MVGTGFIRRDVQAAELLRRGLAIAPRLLVVAALPLLALYFPVIAGIFWWNESFEGRTSAQSLAAAEALLAAASVVTGPVLAGLLARVAIRTSFNDRPPLSEALGIYISSLAASLKAGLAAGLATAAGYILAIGFGLAGSVSLGLWVVSMIQGDANHALLLAGLAGLVALVLPVVLGPLLFVVGPAAAVETESRLAAVFRRSIVMTKGQRFRLFMVLLFTAGAERVLFRFAQFGMDGRVNADDVRLAVWLMVAASMCVSLFRAAVAVMAYSDLRIAHDELEADALLEIVGGTSGGEATRAIDEADPDALAGHQRRKRWFVAAVPIAVVVALGAWAGNDWLEERRKKELWNKQYDLQQARRESDARRRAEADAKAAASAKTAPATHRPAPPEPVITTEEAAAEVAAASDDERVAVLRKALKRHRRELYGPVHRVPTAALAPGIDDARRKLGVIPVVSAQLAKHDCKKALDDAMAADSSPSRVLAKGCKAISVMSAKNRRALRLAPLWASALALDLELAADAHETTADPLHRLVIDYLLSRRAE